MSSSTVAAQTIKYENKALVAQIVGTAIFSFGVAAYLDRKSDSVQSSASVGLAYFIGILVSSVATFGMLNPAIALGARTWSVVYVLGPVIGGIVGVNLFNFMAMVTKKK